MVILFPSGPNSRENWQVFRQRTIKFGQLVSWYGGQVKQPIALVHDNVAADVLHGPRDYRAEAETGYCCHIYTQGSKTMSSTVQIILSLLTLLFLSIIT
ncbi:MAG: hypothetical protein Q8K43_02585, partial [Sulfurimicrobium sp.]|nr:hypothetical protein [Sulfurimicrobium sp.]